MENSPASGNTNRTTHIVSDVIAYALLGGFWVYTFYQYSTLPETIPTHYNLKGIPDDFGDKSMIFLLPALGTIMFAAFTLILFYYQRKSLPGQSSSTTRTDDIRQILPLFRTFRTLILLTFMYLTMATVLVARGQSQKLNIQILLIFSVLLLIPVFRLFLKQKP